MRKGSCNPESLHDPRWHSGFVRNGPSKTCTWMAISYQPRGRINLWLEVATRRWRSKARRSAWPRLRSSIEKRSGHQLLPASIAIDVADLDQDGVVLEAHPVVLFEVVGDGEPHLRPADNSGVVNVHATVVGLVLIEERGDFIVVNQQAPIPTLHPEIIGPWVPEIVQSTENSVRARGDREPLWHPKHLGHLI